MTDDIQPLSRFTIPMLDTLACLMEQGKTYGLRIADSVGMKTGTIYPILSRFERAHWVASTWEQEGEIRDRGARRRYYWLTPAGRVQAEKILKERRGKKPSKVPPGPTCSDCAVEVGDPHQNGCSVARCTLCGFQRIICQHGSQPVGWGQIWTGLFPGTIEVRSGVAKDLNELGIRAERGDLVWNRTLGLWERSHPHFSELSLPDHLAYLGVSIRGEYEDKVGTGVCCLVLKGSESDEEGVSLTLDYRTMRHVADYLLQLAEEAEEVFLEARGVLDHL